MKALKLIFIAVIVITVFAANEAAAQAIVVHDSELTFYVNHPDRESPKMELKSLSSKTTITSFGNIVKTATFQLPDKNFLIPEKGTKTIIVGVLTVDGVELRDERVDVHEG